MEPEKATALVLMDLWAFAYSQDHSAKTRREFEMACRMAEKLALPEVRVFRSFVDSVDCEIR